MLSLASSLRRTATAGRSLPPVFALLENEGVKFRLGQMSMIAAAAGCGKSVVGEILAVKARVPTLYFSADMDSYTTALRAAAIITGQAQDRIAADMTAGGAEFYEDELWDELTHLRVVFESAPTLSDVEENVEAFATMYGEYPQLIVIDNLLNFQQGVGEWESLQESLLGFKQLVSSTGAHVCVLHHVGGPYADKPDPPPKSGIQGKVDQLPEMILTLGRDGNKLDIAPVKHRNGRANAKAEFRITYYVDLPTMQMTERSPTWSPSAWATD